MRRYYFSESPYQHLYSTAVKHILHGDGNKNTLIEMSEMIKLRLK